MSQPRDQHIVPRFYLDGFSLPSPGRRQPTLWVYEKGKPVRPSTASHEARERDFYTVRRGDQVDYRFEYFLSQIEALIAPILRALDDPNHFFTVEEKSMIGFFVALMHARVRSYREYVDKSLGKLVGKIARERAEDRELFEADVRAFEAHSGKSLDAESMRQVVLNGKLRFHPSVSFNLWMVGDVIQQLKPILLKKAWHLVRCDHDFLFVTSDNPVSTVGLDSKGRAVAGMGFGRVGVQVVFPLRAEVCLVMEDGAEDTIDIVDPGSIQNYNKATMLFAHKNLFAAKESSNLNAVFQRIGCTVVYGENAFLPSRNID